MVTTNTLWPYFPEGPASVDDARIVWKDYRFSYETPDFGFDIFAFDIPSLTYVWNTYWDGGPFRNAFPSTEGRYVVWQGWNYSEGSPDPPENIDIYVQDLSLNVQKRITSALAPQERPTIAGTRVVFQDKRHGNWEIYSRDLATSVERRLTDNAKDQLLPRISEGRVVFQDARNGQWDVYLYDFASGATRRLTDEAAWQQTPDISGTRVVWQDNRYDADGDIYLMDLSTGTEKRLTSDGSAQLNPRVSGPLVVWEDKRAGQPHVYLYDALSGIESRLSSTDSTQTTPDIHGMSAVWLDSRRLSLTRSYPDIMLAQLQIPVLAIAAEATTTFGGRPTVSATLSEPGGVLPLAGVDVRIQQSANLLNWSTVGTMTTDAAGRIKITSPAIRSKTYYRAVCPGDASRLSVEATPTAVVPRANLTRPSASRIGTRRYCVSDYLQPRHAAGSKPVRIYMQYKADSTWTTQGYFYATAENFYSYSRCRAIRTFSKNGSWRIRAYHEDWSHSPTFSAWRYITVH